MAKVYVEFDIADQTLCTHIPTSTIRAGTQGTYFAKFSFDAAWADLANIRAVFFRDKLYKAMDLVKEDDSFVCEIHPAVIAEPGQFSLGLFAGKQQITNLEFVPVLPSFKNELFQNADVLDWFATVDQALQEVDRVFNIVLDEQTGIADKTFSEIQTAIDNKNKVVTVNGDPIDTIIIFEVDLNDIITAVVFTVGGADFVRNVQINADGSFVWSERDSLLRKSRTVTEITEDADDAQYPTAKAVHTFTQEAIAQFVNTLARNPITITETLNGTSSTFVSDCSYAQIVAFEGLPYVRYMLDVGAGANLVCEAPLYVKDETKFVFASAPDAAGVSYHFVIDGTGVSVSAFSAKEYFAPVPFISEDISEDTGNAEIPNVFAVRNYVAEKQPLVFTGTVNIDSSVAKITFDSNITSEEFNDAIEAGRDIKMHLTVDGDANGAVFVLPATVINNAFVKFSAIVHKDFANPNTDILSVSVNRINPAVYLANYLQISVST